MRHVIIMYPLLLAAAAFVVCCHAAVYGDAAYRNVLSSIPGITFVTTTPSMTDDTSVYFTGFSWPPNRAAQQADYVSVPVAAMALCLAVQPRGSINVTVAPSMTEIGDVLLGRSTGAAWLRSDVSPSTSGGVTKVYWASSSTPALVNSLATWYGAPFTSGSTLPAAVASNGGATVLATDTDVLAALAANPSAIAFMPLVTSVVGKMACLSITTPTASGGRIAVDPQMDNTMASLVSYNTASLSVTCPINAGCYPMVGALVAHVRKRTSMTSVACNTSTSLLPVIFSFTSSTAAIAAAFGRWSMLFPPTATQMVTLQALATSTCMPETMQLAGVGGVLRVSALNDWFYEYYMQAKGTVVLSYTPMNATTALIALDARTADFASGSALTASDRVAHPELHSFPSLGTAIALVVNVGQDVSVTLPRCSITSIFNGTIQWWNDPAIEAVNPMVVMPQQRIDVTLRVEPSPSTDIFMAGLRSLDMECFGTTSIAPSALLPSISRASRFTGNVAVANYVAATPYSITWVPFDYAKSNTYLNRAKVQASDGSVTTSTDTEQALEGGTFDAVTSDYTLSTVTMGYPFVGISSFIVPLTAVGACARNRALSDFIIWTLSSPKALALAIAEQLQPMSTAVNAACVELYTDAAMCDGQPVYPVAPVPLLWWPVAFAVGTVTLLMVMLGARAWYRHWLFGARPTDPTKPMAVMFVGVKNQAAVTEAGEMNVAAVHHRVADTVRRMVRKHRCYEARRVDAWTTMIVAKTAQTASSCAEDIVLSLSVDVQWVEDVMKHPLPGQQAATNNAHKRASKVSAVLSARSSNRSGGSGRDVPIARRAKTLSGHLSRSHATHTTSSSHTRLNVQQCVPQIYVGVHWAHVMIDQQEDDVVSYFGAGIAAAASVADLAVDGQVVVSREVVDELQAAAADQDSDYTWSQLTTSDEDGVTAMSLTTPRFPEWLLARTAARRKSLEEKGADGGAGNTIAAAMASADGALAKRRIAVVSLLMRDLVADGAEGRAGVVRDALEELREILTEHRGEIHSITDGVVTVTIGASGPVAMASVRAAEIAVDAAELCVAAGVHSGVALVGNALGGKSATVGRIVTGASLMRLVAERANIGVVVSDAVHADVSARFQLATVDLIAAPWDLKKHIRCYGVAEARVDAGDNEWLYEMQDGFAPLECRFDEVLNGNSKATETSPSSDAASGFLERHAEYCSLSNELYNSLCAAHVSDVKQEFMVRRLAALGAFSMVRA